MTTNVLIVDDCSEFAEVVAEMLEIEGYEVTLAAGPEAAMTAASKKRFDLVLCDLVMPIEDGEECAIVGVNAIHRFAKAFPRVPIIAMSGELTGAPLGEIRQFGASSVISKPFEREELLQKVNTVLGR